MLAKGNGWQRLRARCFDAIPTSAMVYHGTAVPLNQWRSVGAFRVRSCDKKAAVLETAGVEIGTALLSDVEYLLDHGAEHRSALRGLVVEAQWHSPAWTVVTAYYWAFFSALAVTRLTGKTTLYLDKRSISNLRTLAASAHQPPAGALTLSVEQYISGTDREVTLRPTGAHLHDAAWSVFHDLVSEIFNSCNGGTNAAEYRFFWCLNEARVRLGADWPSRVRNIVNYTPGCAYKEVVRDTVIDAAPYVRRGQPFSLAKLIEAFENIVMPLKPSQPIAPVIPELCRALMLLCFMIGLIVNELHSELIERQPSDRRWLNLRRAFLRQHCPSADGHSDWPLTS